MAAIGDSYIDSTDPKPYSQIIVLSQKVINDAFKKMWKIAQLDDSDTPLKHFKYDSRDGSLEGDIGIPSVKLQVTTTDPMLYFMLRISKGSLFLYLSSDAKDASHITWDIDDWTVAFSVTISKEQILKNSPEYAKFKARASLPESSFSLARLFIHASSSTEVNYKLSNFGDKSTAYNELTKYALANFKTLIQTWLNTMDENGCNVLGYQAEREKDSEVNKYVPSFGPTSIDYFCYPWRGPNGLGHDEDNQDENTLCYLMMSNFDNSPATKAIDYTGAWVDGKDRGAIFCMSRELFWPWMQSTLREVVIGMVPYPDTPTCVWKGDDPKLPYDSEMQKHAGDDGATDDLYCFTKSSSKGWSLDGPDRHSDATAKNPHDSNDKMELKEDCVFSKASLNFEPGTEKIDLSGSSTFTFRADHHWSPDHSYTKMTFNITWSISLAIASVDDGGLVFKIIEGSDKVDVDHKEEGDMRWDPPPVKLAADWASSLDDSMKKALSKVENNLLYALANQHRLHLPAKGSFLMTDPKFNSNGDLLVELTYNGDDPPPPSKRKLRD